MKNVLIGALLLLSIEATAHDPRLTPILNTVYVHELITEHVGHVDIGCHGYICKDNTDQKVYGAYYDEEAYPVVQRITVHTTTHTTIQA